MSRRARRLAARTASGAVRTRGGDGRGLVTFRHIATLSGVDPAQNPPRVSGLVVDGNPAQGDTSMGVRAAALVGRFVPGDRLFIGDAILTVAADAVAAGNAASLTLTAGLPGPLADGEGIAVAWVNEATCVADIVGLGRRVPDGRLIKTRDLFLTVAARLLPFEPDVGDRVTLPSGDVREIVALTPMFLDGIPISYRIQVR